MLKVVVVAFRLVVEVRCPCKHNNDIKKENNGRHTNLKKIKHTHIKQH